MGANSEAGDTFFAAGYSFILGRGEGDGSNILTSYFANANLGQTAQGLRNFFKTGFGVGNKLQIANSAWAFEFGGGSGKLIIRDHIFAMESDLHGLYFESENALDMGDGNARKFCMFAPATRPRCTVHYTRTNEGAYLTGRLVTEPIGPLYKWDQAAGACALVTQAELTTLKGVLQADGSYNGQALKMYLLDPD